MSAEKNADMFKYERCNQEKDSGLTLQPLQL